jgi:L-threonylcarbamoyladenylate synthase
MPSFRIVDCTDKGITECAKAIKNGAVIVFPTDTVYGLGCDPYNASAVKRIFEIKRRDQAKPMPVLARSIHDAEKIVSLGKQGRILAEKFWPGALTIVATLSDSAISPILTAGSRTLAVRVPANKCALSLLDRCTFLVGTSANVSEARPARTAEEVLQSGLDGFDLLLDGGRVEGGVESTIVDANTLNVLRKGTISVDEIRSLIGAVVK